MKMGRIWMSLLRYGLPGGSVSFWHTALGPVVYDYPSLDDYYIDFTAKTAYRGPFDASGVPMLNYRGSIGQRYNPCATAQYALGWYQRWRRGDASCRPRFFRMADWLTRSIHVDACGRGFWYYDFDLDAYGAKAPWISALAQAQGIAVLLRAARYGETPGVYEEASKAAYRGMMAPVSEGGTLLVDGDDVWLEEIVADRLTAILDGYIFALWGVRDLAYHFADREAEGMWVRGIETIRRHLGDFDLGYWSRADLYQKDTPMPSSSFYHGLHVAQMQVLHRQTGIADFARIAGRWQEQLNSPVARTRAFWAKVAFKLWHY